MIVLGCIAVMCALFAVRNGEWGSAAVGAVIALVLFLMAYGARRDGQAYVNRREYWADYNRKNRR